MKSIVIILSAILLSTNATTCIAQEETYKNDDFSIREVSVKHNSNLRQTVWEISVLGTAGKTTPTKVGQLDGAPVLGYVFPTNLKSTDVGFNQTDGIVALALTSHPDFDDTPLWDENSDNVYDNDGIIWHPHWVILHEDKRVKGGLAVKQFKKADETIILPPTNPGMPMYMDSPGYPVVTTKHKIKVVIPDYRINNKIDFSYDGVTAFMKVNTSNENLPMLGVYEVFSIASGDLSLPFKVELER
ncbi:MAG: hypothetical protein JKY48_15990 [Flavobacteriales bacterium]|nr:hypothetical protein [Flavobacteriales bacterium]